MKLKFFIYFSPALFILTSYSFVFADTPATPCSYSVSTNDEKYIFVLLAPENQNECLSQGKEGKEKAQKLREQFKLSGVYENKNPTKPLWTVDWYSYKTFLTSDGKYLVRTGPWASNSSDEAFSFFKEGDLLKTYKVEDIVRYVSALPHSVSHFEWEKELKLNDVEKTFEVTTLEEERFVFNVENGEMISGSRPVLPTATGLSEPRFYISNLLAIICIIIFTPLLLFIAYKKLFRKKK